MLSPQLSLVANHNIVGAALVIYVATIFFGNIAAFTSLWFSFEGVLGPWGVVWNLIAIFAANLSGDMLWYGLGFGLRSTRFGNWIKRRISNERHEKFEDHIERRGKQWMMFGKFAYGSNVPIIFSIGWTRAISFKAFFRNSLLAISIWLPVILGVSFGLYSGLAPLGAAISTVKDFEIAFVLGLVLFVLVQYGLVRGLKRILGKR